MRAIDTNALVRLITRDDLAQVAAAEAFIKDGAWVSLPALVEAAWVLSSVCNLSPRNLAKTIEMLLDHRDLVIQETEAVSEALELFRAKPGLGFSDCLILHLARKAGHLPLGTFDRNLSKAGGAQKL